MNNKYLNNIIKKSLLLGSFMVVASSCVKDLDRFPTNDVTNKKVYETPEGTMQALAKVYGAWAMTEGDVAGMDDGSTGFVRNFWNLNVLPTDEGVCSWTDPGVPDIHNMSWSTSNDFIKGLYYRSIIQIKLANEFLINISSANVSQGEKDQMSAEARFVRAFQYWVLMDCFGNPPFITEKDQTGKEAPKQIMRADLFKYVESELLDIQNKLPDARKNSYGRADKAAVFALLARLYINAEVYTGTQRWDDAALYAQKVIDAGYSLKPKYSELFLSDNNVDNPEVILSINFDGKKSQSYAGTTFLVQSSFNGDMLEDLKAKGVKLYGGGWGGNRATYTFGKMFDDKDSRALIIKQDKPIDDISKFNDGVKVYKFRNVTKSGANGSDQTFSDIDFPLFRLAEMYLIYAEASLRGNADKAKGLEYFNKLRTRAYGNTTMNLTSLSLKDIIDERGRELYWEGFRRTDLIRFGKFTTADYLWDWKGGVKQGKAVSSHLNIYPIPSADKLANPINLKQNTGY